MLIDDVGQNTWEEIDEGVAGANYGWPTTEGTTTDPRFVTPLYSYGHGSGACLGCAITGGTFTGGACAVPGRVCRRLLFRGLLRRMDQPAR